MFSLAVTLGLYSYAIFFLGVTHLLTKTNILIVSLIFIPIFISQFKPLKFPKLNIFLFLITLQLAVNLIGALGPEIGFDALWYHLTLPKIWLQRIEMIFITGAQFKYSVMPMLTEMYYFIFPGKLVHYFFGVLSLIVTYKISRSLLATLILSSNLVFGWQQTSAYIDLSRTFFEIMALYLFLDNKIYKSAVLLGLAASTKLLALGSLPIFWLLLWLKEKSLKSLIRYTLYVILTVSPWLLRAYYHTGNPVHPFFSPLYTDTKISLDPRNLLTLFTHAADPLHPIYLPALLLLLFTVTKLSQKLKMTALYSLLSLVVWQLTPNSGGGRFILPYLPALSIIAAQVASKFKVLTLFIILYSLFTISYRFTANLKYLQPQEQLLKQKLAFNFGDYYDFDHFFQPSDRVLPIGINNLYYLNSYVAFPDEKFEYILVHGSLPREFKDWKLVSQNAITKTQIYAPPR